MKLLLLLLLWSNGQQGNATTNLPAECADPPYSTHDWIADHALAMLPLDHWLHEHRTMFLLGTEAPDSNKIPDECNAPNNGYDDRLRGHSIEWDSDWTTMINDRAARRAEEEYYKAEFSVKNKEFSNAAFYLGAMAHQDFNVYFSELINLFPEFPVRFLYVDSNHFLTIQVFPQSIQITIP